MNKMREAGSYGCVLKGVLLEGAGDEQLLLGRNEDVHQFKCAGVLGKRGGQGQAPLHPPSIMGKQL